ncbi:hypothetical protein G9A89_013070, partial [Geosiphon pyriformis]
MPRFWISLITELKDKLIKKVCPHALADLATAIRHAKNYEMTIEKANHTKFVNLTIEETSSATEEKIDQLTKKQRPNYHTQLSYLTISEKLDFQQSALFEGKVVAPRSNPSNNTILPAQIAHNANLSDIFLFKFEANESLFLLSNAAVNEQRAITTMYTEAEVKEKPIQLILDSELAENSIKKTPVKEIDNFLFTINKIIILVKVLVMNANVNLDWKTQKLKILYQRQYTRVPVTCSTFNKKSEKVSVFEFKEKKELPITEIFMALGSSSNWAKETEQEIFKRTRRWNVKKLLSMGACIFPKKEYETCTYYFCKASHREQFGYFKRNGKWDNIPCLICRDMLLEECNWINIAIREGVFRRKTLFNAAYNSVLNKLYYYFHDAEIIFDLAMALINGATQKNIRQMKETEYIEYTIELAKFNYEDKFENLKEPFGNWQTFKNAFLQQFTNNNTSITLQNHFCNIKQEISKTLIKKVCPHALADLATAIRHAKNYEMTIEKANHTKFVNLTIEETSSATEEKIDQLTKKQRPNYHTQLSYLTISEKLDFQQSALFEGKVVAPRSNPSNNTILPAQIAHNANLSDIFLFKFEANESLFLLSNAAVNEQRAITTMYTEAEVKEKPIQLILDSELAENSIKKTPVKEIDNFLFTINKIIILVKVLVMNANVNLDWKTQKLKILYQRQYTRVPVTCSTFNKKSEKVSVFEFKEKKELPITEIFMALGSSSNWAKETEQEIFKRTRRWNVKKLLSMGACIFPKKEYETCTYYFCKASHREQFGYFKRNGKWDNIPCLICRDMLLEECNWINIAIREGVFRRKTLFNAAYNSVLNKLYYYFHDAEIIFDLAMALINGATQKNIRQMKETEYIEYTIELAKFNYEDKVETYHQITSHTYPTQEAQIQQLKQINIQ